MEWLVESVIFGCCVPVLRVASMKNDDGVRAEKPQTGRLGKSILYQ